MKRTMIILLTVLVMVLTTSSALADNVRTSGLYTYQIKGNGTITITDFNWEKNNGDVYVPNMIDGYTVSEIGAEAFKFTDTKKNRGTQVIVTLPATVKSIGDFAFWGAGLTGVNIPDSVQFIGKGAFVGCNQCQFKVNPNHPKYAVIDNALYDKTKKELIALGDIESEYGRFTIPEGIRSVGDYAMYQSSPRVVVLPTTLQTIGDYAFFGMTLDKYQQQGRDIPFLNNGLISIGDYAFSEVSFEYGRTATVVNTITIPDSVEHIGIGCFSNITSYTYTTTYTKIEINKNSHLRNIPQDAFRNSELSITINGEINTIGSYAFSGAYDKPFVTINNISCIEEIDEGAFWEDSTHEHLYSHLHGHRQIYDPSAPLLFSASFATLPKYFNLLGTLPDTVKSISSQAYTKPVNDFLLPESIESIADDAFPKGSSFIVVSGSYAEFWCVENGFGYTIEGQNNLDWLLN